ncbi:MAG: hypothetical protein CMC52_02150 [Flavobacteriaceae bacterium]|nr:hypothetical protein [Flavobacteriaceae bacterium]
MHVRNRNENWRPDMTTYRGIKMTSENVSAEKVKPQAGIYRGTKHDAIIVEKSNAKREGNYRGIKHVA